MAGSRSARRNSKRPGAAGGQPGPTGKTEPGRRRFAFEAFDLWVFVVALAVRLAVWVQIRSLPIVRSPSLDSLEYLEWGRRIAGGDFSWPAPPPHGPGYPYFLGFILALSHGSLPAVAVVQSIVGAAGCVLVAVLARRFFGRAAGLLAGLLLAVDGVVAFLDVSLLSEGLLLVLLSAALLVLANDGVSRPGRALAAGALIGLASLVRPTALSLLPVAGAVLFAAPPREGRARRAGVALLAAVAAGLVILPVTFANLRATGAPLLVQGHGGFNFWIGNSPARDGLPSVRPGAGWDRLEGEAARAGMAGPGEQDRYFVRKTIAEIRDRPFRWIALLASKLLWTIQADEVRDPYSFEFFRREAPLLRVLPGFGLLFPLALFGAVAAARARPRPWLLYGAAAAAIASAVLLVTSFRYRLPLVPVLAIFAAAGLVEMFRRRRLGARAWIFPVSVLLAGTVASRIERHAPSRNFAEEWSATGFALNHERDLAGAERAFRAALQADGRWGPAWAGLGIVAANRGDLAAARASLERAASLDPGSVLANLELARLSSREGKWDESERAFRAVLASAPREEAALEGLGSVLLTQRRAADAEGVLRRAAALAPASASVRLLLARALGAQHRWPEAIEEASRAADLDPSNAESWWTLGMLRVDAGLSRGALDAFDRAETAGGDPRTIGVGRARALAAAGDRPGAEAALRKVLEIDPAYPTARRLLADLAASNR